MTPYKAKFPTPDFRPFDFYKNFYGKLKNKNLKNFSGIITFFGIITFLKTLYFLKNFRFFKKLKKLFWNYNFLKKYKV